MNTARLLPHDTLETGVTPIDTAATAEPSDQTGTDRTALVFLRNILSSSAGRLAMMVVSFVSTAILVQRLGQQVYGLWAVAFTLPGYLVFVDVGVNGGLVRMVSAANARGETTKVSGYVTTALAFYSMLGLVLLAAVFVTRQYLAHLLGVPSDLLTTAGWLLVGVTAVFVLNNLMFVFTGMLSALEAIHLASLAGLVAASLNGAGLIIAVLVFHAGVYGLLAASLLTAAAGTSISALWALRIYPALNLAPGNIGMEHLRDIAGLSFSIQISNMAGVVNFTVDKFIVARIIGLATAGLFDLGSRLTVLVWMLSWMVAQAAYPVAARLSESSPGEVRAFYVRAERYLVVTCCGLGSLLAVTAPWLVHFWLGRGYSQVILVTQVLAVASAALSLTNVAKVTLWGMRRVREATVYEVWRLVMHVILSAVLTWKFGFHGALVGAFIAFTVPSFWLLWVTHRILLVGNPEWLRTIFTGPVAAAGVAGGATLLLVNEAATHVVSADTRPGALALLALSGSLFCLLFVAVTIKLRVFPPEDLATLRQGRAAVLSRFHAVTGIG